MNPDNKINDLKQACQTTLEFGDKYGAEIYVSASHGIQSKISYEKNDYNLATHHDGSGLSITLYKDQKSGSTSINTFNPKEIELAIKKCLAMAEFSIPDPYLSLAPKADYKAIPLFFDSSLVEMDMSSLKKMLTQLVEETLAEEKIIIDNTTVERTLSARVIANSKNMMACDYNATLSWFTMGMGKTADELTSMDYHGDYSYNTQKLEEKLIKSSNTFKKKLLAYLNAKQGESFKGKVLIPPTLVDEFILDPILFHLKGSNLMDGKSRWENQLNNKILPENLSIEDHPHDTELRGCTAFSGEGIPTNKMTIIEKGIPKVELETVYTANKRNTKPTGNGSGPHSAVIPPGHESWLKLCQQDQLIIPSRFSGNFDPLNGDFSGIAKGSQLYKNGNHQGSLKETMIAGNIFDILKNGLEFSSEQESDFGYYRLPYALVDGVSITSS